MLGQTDRAKYFVSFAPETWNKPFDGSSGAVYDLALATYKGEPVRNGDVVIDAADDFLGSKDIIPARRYLPDRFKMAEPGAFRNVAAIPAIKAAFNPIRQYNDELRRARPRRRPKRLRSEETRLIFTLPERSQGAVASRASGAIVSNL